MNLYSYDTPESDIISKIEPGVNVHVEELSSGMARVTHSGENGWILTFSDFGDVVLEDIIQDSEYDILFMTEIKLFFFNRICGISIQFGLPNF